MVAFSFSTKTQSRKHSAYTSLNSLSMFKKSYDDEPETCSVFQM